MHTKKIKEFAKLRRGASPRPIDDPKYFGGEVGWVRIADVTASRKYLRSTTQYVSKLGESFSIRVDKGDLVISIAGTVGRPIIIDMPACIHDGFVQIYDFKDSDVEFLYYYLKHLEKSLTRYGQSGTQTNLNIDIVSNIELNCFGKKEEKRIASIIAAIDTVIEQTETVIAKYNSIKTGLLQDLLTKGIDKDGNIRNESTHEFEMKDGIKVPKEWEVSPTINELYMKGRIGWQGLKASEFQEEGNYLVTGIHFTKDNRVDWGRCYRINDFRYNEAPEIQLREKDVLITKDGTIGKVAYIDILPGKASLNSHLLVLRPLTNNVLARFLYYLFLDSRFKFFIESIKSGSTLVGLSQTNFGKYKLLIPPIDEQEKIVSILEEVTIMIERESAQLVKLEALRTGLMQDLFSGKVRVQNNVKQN